MHFWLQDTELSHNYTECTTSMIEERWKDIFFLLKQWHHFENIKKPPLWICETLEQFSDKYLLTGMESKIDLMDTMKWRVQTTKSPTHTL